MIWAKTSLPWFIGEPRDGRHHGLANAAIRVEIETRQKHKLSFSNQIVITPLVLNVGTALKLTKNLIESGPFQRSKRIRRFFQAAAASTVAWRIPRIFVAVPSLRGTWVLLHSLTPSIRPTITMAVAAAMSDPPAIVRRKSLPRRPADRRLASGVRAGWRLHGS